MLLLLSASLGSMWYFGGTKIWSFSPPLLAFALGLALFLLRPFLFAEVDRLPVPPGGLASLVVVALLVAWIPFAPVRFDALLVAARIASAVAAYWAWAELARHHGRWRKLLGALIFVVAVMGWYAIIQHGHASNLVLGRPRPEQYGMRASGAFVCPNHFAHLIAMALTLAFAFIASRESGWVLRLLSGYAWLVLAPVLYMTQSRSGWLGLGAGVLTVLAVGGWRAGPLRMALRVLLGGLALAALGVALWTWSPVFHARVAAALQGDIRLVLWRDTWGMIRERPWTGFGPGSFRWVFPHYQAHFRHYMDPEYAHNEYVHASAELGLPGLLLLLLPFVVAAVRLLARVRRTGHARDALLIAAGLGVWAATGLHAAFDFNLQVFSNLHALALISGAMLCGWWGEDHLPAASPGRRRWMRAAAALALAGVAALAGVTACSWRAWGLTERGRALKDALRPDEAEKAFVAARRWAPWYAEPAVGLGDLARARAFWLRVPDLRRAAAEESLGFYAEAERLNPWQMEARLGRCKVLRLLGRGEESLAGLADIARRVPYHAYYLAQWGLALSEAQRYPEALDAFRRSQAAADSPMAQAYIPWLQERIAAAPPSGAKMQ